MKSKLNGEAKLFRAQTNGVWLPEGELHRGDNELKKWGRRPTSQTNSVGSSRY